jgi:hypothetical protein
MSKTEIEKLTRLIEVATAETQAQVLREVITTLIPDDGRNRLLKLVEAEGYETAALALVERVLPGWMWYVGSVGENDMPQATITEPVEDCRDFVGHATTAPLAILLAMLKALQESHDAQ